MEEKTLEKNQGEMSAAANKTKVVVKKAYTPPSLTLYGKLTDLTAGGSLGDPEPINPGTPKPPFKQRP